MLRRRWCPSPLCLLLLHPLLLSTSASLPSNLHFVNCSEYLNCGSLKGLNVTYPFRLSLSPSYCGYPGYELNCNPDDEAAPLTIKIGGEDYAVQNIYYEQKTVTVVDSNFMRTECPISFTNTSINSTLFNYTSLDHNLTVYINCSFPTMPPGLLEISCLNEAYSPTKSYYKVGNGPSTFSENLFGSCDKTAAVAVHNNQTFGGALKEGFGLTWSNVMDWCQNCKESGGMCGYNESRPGDHLCFCSETNYLDSCFHCLSASLICLLLLCIPLYFYIIQSNRLNTFIFWKMNNIAQTIETFLVSYEYLGPKRYKYSAVKKITKSFSEKLGQGGYGAVFKGKFPDGRSVAVKLLSGTKGNGDEFVNEVASIGRTSHVNVVSLLGFCSEGSKRALIYEFMPNGSLADNLKSTLGWDKLYQIAVGIARGLEYLHRGCSTRIVHFDIKPHNILLDQDFCPKISDFGLAQLCLRKDSMFSAIEMRGTIGYIAPELFSRNFGVVSSKSDVYSYGMMILEMVGVRSNRSQSCNESDSGYYFPHWIYENFHQIGRMEGLDVTAETVEIAKKMSLVGLWCIQTKPGSRPTMSKVVDMLQSSIDQLELPPKPYFASP
ncbi:LEAF RUST 10 DISEASE-RESISTANCE LOCUS RECEPTOR-LIKE PROTEIN KINASE-like 2.1 isoform X2 [Phalaenopsis equestris]|uniref:LEAF RUST 10 DISEASE-RESISTANCE LOCUS RECEPTOR-LIKE PROTEIN KINASE-like 2.1 isoform X2 n=1 Tax=Phalaenopsis equestris TaxID=78828 RepID=UPI0009E4DBA5|nr:LEAF RUST 10 DISEASE-RESISTANCE LOCUS RECEPTOR-LIKE PROTEIN KINASE-like 2.1 isoform X2 [Phalaenopsis equestris]